MRKGNLLALAPASSRLGISSHPLSYTHSHAPVIALIVIQHVTQPFHEAHLGDGSAQRRSGGNDARRRPNGQRLHRGAGEEEHSTAQQGDHGRGREQGPNARALEVISPEPPPRQTSGFRTMVSASGRCR
jgi:hypothetical protein